MLGTAYRKDAAIPQGGPLSMMVAAMVMRPWAIRMRQEGLEPYLYVDDMLRLAKGPNAVDKLREATNWTMQYLENMGAKASPQKSFAFGSSK